MPMPSTQAAIAAALLNNDPAQAIMGVKQAVADEIQALDPTAKIESTQYFNHSYVPDFLVSWNNRSGSDQRSVFLRPTVHSALLGGDVEDLADSGPIILAFNPDSRDVDSLAEARSAVSESSRLLVTAVPALDQAVAPRSADLNSPLLPLVRHSIVQGARGVLDEQVINELVTAAAPPADAPNASETFSRFGQLAAQVFREDSALRLQRTSELLRLGLSSTLEGAPAARADQLTNVFEGQLSTAELHSLLPYLLARPDVTQDESFWRQLGSMMDLASLELISDALVGLDLGVLIAPNADTWLAARGGLTSVAEDEELSEGSELAGWRIDAGLLCLFVAGWRLHVTTNGTRVRGRADSLSARWVDLAPVISNSSLTLANVQLRGVTRTLDIGATDDEDATADVGGDVRSISSTIQEEFLVPRASVKDRDLPGYSRITADFSRMIAYAEAGRAPVASITKVAMRLLGYRYAIGPRDAERFLQ